jgi:hypothetical protein
MFVSSTITGWFVASISLIIGAVIGPLLSFCSDEGPGSIECSAGCHSRYRGIPRNIRPSRACKEHGLRQCAVTACPQPRSSGAAASRDLSAPRSTWARALRHSLLPVDHHPNPDLPRGALTIGCCWLSHSVCAESEDRSPGSPPGSSQPASVPPNSCCWGSSCSGASPSAAMASSGWPPCPAATPLAGRARNLSTLVLSG